MVEDVVRSLGFLCLGSRMKRIAERLQADTQQIIDAHGLAIQSAQFPFLAAIDRLGPLSIGDLAEAVGVTQPGATRTVSQLAALGHVEIVVPPEDQRRRIVSLTPGGAALVDYARAKVWPLVEAAARDLCAGKSAPILDQFAAMEEGLAAAPLSRRTGGASA